jgi:glycosyltransferase involved in cell wall biosynthesis
MRVLTVGNMYPPHHLGGYELVWQAAVGYLASRGHAVRVLTTDHQRDADMLPESENDTENNVYRELQWYWRDHAWPKIPIRERVRMERGNWKTLDRHIASFEPDVLGWWSMGGMSLSLIQRVIDRRIPSAGFVCEGWLDYGPKVDGWMRLTRWPLLGPAVASSIGIPTRVSFEEVGYWLFPSEILRSKSSALRGLSRTEVAPQGVDQGVFRRAERPPWRFRLLYVGRIDPRKGIDLAIRALPALPEATLLIVGDGDEEHLAELRQLASQEAVAERVTFQPGEPRERLRDRYAEADALLFPVRWQEPWGLVPLEAMSVGTPVIATGRGGSGEYLADGENCLIFEPDDGPEALARCVIRLEGDERLRTRLSEAGSATAAGIPADNFSAAVERTLERAIAEGA